MANTQLEYLISIGIDEARAKQAVAGLDAFQKGIDATTQKAGLATRALSEVISTGRKLTEIGGALAGAGALVLAPLTAAANAYSQTYGRLEPQSRSFLDALKAQKQATTDLGREAAQVLAPGLEQAAQLEERIANFAKQNPELLRAVVGGATAAAGIGGVLLTAGITISTIARAAEVLKSAGVGDTLTKFGAALAPVIVTIGALGAGAIFAQQGLNEFGKSTNNAYLANYKLSDSLNTFGQVLGIVIGLIPSAAQTFITASGTLALGITAIVEKFKELGIKIDGFLDQLATAARNLIDSISGNKNLASQSNLNSTSSKLVTMAQNDTTGTDFQRLSMLLTQKDVTQATLDYVNRELDRVAQLKSAQDGLASSTNKIAGNVITLNTSIDKAKPAFGQFIDSIFGGEGKLSKSLSDFVSGIWSKITTAVSSTGLGNSNSTSGKSSINPELVQDWIAYQKNLVQIQQDFDYQKEDLARSENIQLLNMAKNHTREIAKMNLDNQREEDKLFADHLIAKQQMVTDFNRQEEATDKQIAFDKIQRMQQLQYDLQESADQNDVAGFIAKVRQFNFQSKQADEQNDFERKNRLIQFKQKQEDQDIANKRELDQLHLSQQQRKEDLQTSYNQQLADLKESNQQQLDQMNTANDRAKQAALKNFADQAAALADSNTVLGQIRDAYYQQATTAATKFVNNNLAILSKLYSTQLGQGGYTQPGALSGSQGAGAYSSGYTGATVGAQQGGSTATSGGTWNSLMNLFTGGSSSTPSNLNGYYNPSNPMQAFAGQNSTTSGGGSSRYLKSYGLGTGWQGLPSDGNFYGHKGEIILNPSDSSQVRSGNLNVPSLKMPSVSGNKNNNSSMVFTLSPNINIGNVGENVSKDDLESIKQAAIDGAGEVVQQAIRIVHQRVS